MKERKKNLRRVASLFLTAVLFVFLASVPALASVPQRPENQYVLDSAGVISDSTEKEIVSQNQKLFKSTGAQVVIVAVDFLDGQEIDDYTFDLFSAWGVGSKQRNNGIVLVMSIGEDTYYAQAGYGIEDYFDGAKMQDLLDDNLEADFAAGNYDAGAKKFFDAVLSELNSYYRDYTDQYTGQTTEYTQGGTYANYGDYGYNGGSSFGNSGFSTFFWGVFRFIIIVVIIIILFTVIRGMTGGGRGGPRGGGGGGGGFWTGMFLGNMMGNNRRNRWRGPPPPPPGGFGGPRPPRGGGGFGGFGGFSGGGRPGGGGGGFRGGGGGFTGGGGTRGGGAGRR